MSVCSLSCSDEAAVSFRFCRLRSNSGPLTWGATQTASGYQGNNMATNAEAAKGRAEPLVVSSESCFMLENEYFRHIELAIANVRKNVSWQLSLSILVEGGNVLFWVDFLSPAIQTVVHVNRKRDRKFVAGGMWEKFLCEQWKILFPKGRKRRVYLGWVGGGQYSSRLKLAQSKVVMWCLVCLVGPVRPHS